MPSVHGARWCWEAGCRLAANLAGSFGRWPFRKPALAEKNLVRAKPLRWRRRRRSKVASSTPMCTVVVVQAAIKRAGLYVVDVAAISLDHCWSVSMRCCTPPGVVERRSPTRLLRSDVNSKLSRAHTKRVESRTIAGRRTLGACRRSAQRRCLAVRQWLA